MKKLFLTVLAASLFIGAPVSAQYQAPKTEQTKTQGQPDEAALDNHKHYTNKSGATVHSPAKSKDGKVPSGATARCGDGSYSFSQNHRGTCSHHGGVSDWL